MLDGFTLVARALRKFFALGLLGVPRPVRRAGAIRVALVDPGATRTAMREKAYPGEDPQTVKPPEEVASRIAELFEGDFETGHRERVG